MGDISHSGSGDHNPADHHDGTRVHLWGHKSPITADHTTYNFEQDPDLVVEIDIPINKRITSAGNKRVLSASAISGSGTERSYRSTNSGVERPPVKSRSRPMKPHETEPFLTVDAMNSGRTSAATSPARLPQRPSSVRRGRAPTVSGRLYVPEGTSPSPYINSGRNTPASSIFVSPTNRQKSKPNVHIKSPFKHSMQKTEILQERPSSPAQDLKDMTAFATFQVGKMLSREPVEQKAKLHGRLLKGKLKPLKPVNVKGPSIEKCRGIVSENRTSLPPANKTLARRREILERIPNVHEYLYDRPRTEESIHRTSRASSVDENRDHIIKEETTELEGETPDVYQSDSLPIGPTGSRMTTNSGLSGPTPTPRMFVTEINGKGKENSPFDNNINSKIKNQLELQQNQESTGGETSERTENQSRPNTAGKLVRFAEGSKEDGEKSKDMKQFQNAKIAEGLRENTTNTVSTENTQMEIAMKVDIKIVDKTEKSKSEENKIVQGEIKIVDKGEQIEKDKKKTKESCKPDDEVTMKKDDDNDDDDNIKDQNDNRYAESKSQNISSSQNAGKTGSQSTEPSDKNVNGKQSSVHACRNRQRYKAPNTLQIQSVLHDGSVYYTLGAESPRRSPSPARSPSPGASSLRSSSDGSRNKFNKLVRPSSAKLGKKHKRRSSESSQSGFSMVTNRKSESTESRKSKVYFEGEYPPHQSIFTENKVGDQIEISLKDDKTLTFDDLDQELLAIQESIQMKREETSDETTFINLNSESTLTDVDCELQRQTEENIMHLELNTKSLQTDDDYMSETPKDNGQSYTDLLDMYRKKCMTVSENCGCISDSLMTPGRVTTNVKRSHSFSRPSSASSRKSSPKKRERRNSFHFEKPTSDTDVPKPKVLFRSPSVVSMATDSGCSIGFEADDKIPNYYLTSAATDSDVCVTDRSEEEKPLLAMVCDQLPPDETINSGNTKIASDSTKSSFQVVATAAEISKPKQVKKPVKKEPVAPFAPLCFTLNARAPTGYLYYFAYGPDMNPSRVSAYLKREVNCRYWGLLYGFQLVFNKKGLDVEAGGFANIELNPFCSVEGVIYQITSEELQLLDNHTGYPEHYTHLMLPVWMSNSTNPDQYGIAQYCVPAVMYIAQDKWINKDETINCDYALQQCIKSSDLVTPDYRDHMVNYCQPMKEQVMCV
ncbi:uncharacterized protein LOC143062752 isoform X2 [Mytilus galloprovincialis]|uniref:uncharacterized protein LOC143062752 isoform X2 n=1 Tax=Mytilus galloprovincialis TaxID=29158 RepID=UPI003F7C3770